MLGGDVQWVTRAGHPAFGNVPAAQRHRAQPLELFQIWLNLPSRNKMGGAALHHAVERAHSAPAHRDVANGRLTTVPWWPVRCQRRRTTGPAAQILGVAAQKADVAIWTLHLGRCALDAARRHRPGHAAHAVLLWGQWPQRWARRPSASHAALEVVASPVWELVNTGTTAVECLLLQGRPIGEPVAQLRPAVMNTQREIMQAMQDYRRTQFGGWPWPTATPCGARRAAARPMDAPGTPRDRDSLGRAALPMASGRFADSGKIGRMNITKDSAVTMTTR